MPAPSRSAVGVDGNPYTPRGFLRRLLEAVRGVHQQAPADGFLASLNDTVMIEFLQDASREEQNYKPEEWARPLRRVGRCVAGAGRAGWAPAGVRVGSPLDWTARRDGTPRRPAGGRKSRTASPSLRRYLRGVQLWYALLEDLEEALSRDDVQRDREDFLGRLGLAPVSQPKRKARTPADGTRLLLAALAGLGLHKDKRDAIKEVSDWRNPRAAPPRRHTRQHLCFRWRWTRPWRRTSTWSWTPP
ncbi:hypothetical protein ONE63_005796 [Megalurothrips usitatus]|uniref:Uncharacterized protein n=1 Tax=Megalurothrips usitatus TaxID=439358 RepID=A0AAV7Y3J2_9NEOP|nr:hypothetical protein ONE63_005796 [Megalurothrips usitatus]